MAQGNVRVISKAEKRAQREKREIAKLESELLRPQSHSYFFYLIFIICVIYITDEVATQIRTQMQMVIAQALFAPIFGHEVAVARMGLVGTILLLGAPLSILYKPLSDRYGRKVFLVVNTFGMGIGLFFMSIATGIPVYLIGSFLIGFFIPHDVQAVYILESVPAKRRASYYSAIKAIATLGMLLIPLLRYLVMGDDIMKWRGVFLIPAIFAAVVAALALFAVRETTPFMKKRLEYLYTSDEDRMDAKKDKGAEKAQGGIISAVRYVMRHKQLKWLLLGGGFLLWGAAITGNYETIMTYGYAGEALAEGMAFEEAHSSVLPLVTQALFLFPFGSAFFQFIQGFFADKLGRKPTIIMMSMSCLTSFILFYFGVNIGWSPWLIGLLCGGAIGSYWATIDLAGIMGSESTPTNLRASVMTVQPVMSLIFTVPAIIAGVAAPNILGDAYIGIISFCIAVPGLFAGMLIIMLKTRETKGVNLDEVTGKE